MIQGSVDFDAVHFVDCYTTKAIAAIFSRFGNARREHHNRWLEAASARSDVVMKFIGDRAVLTPEAVGGIAMTISPLAIDLERFPINFWATTLTGDFIDTLGAPNPKLEVCAFTFALALRAPNSVPSELGVLCFRLLHQAEASPPGLPDRAWRMIDSLLPDVAPTRSWDKCERLRRAVIELAVRGNWSMTDVAQMRADKDLFDRLLECALSISYGEQFLSALGDSVGENLSPQVHTEPDVAKRIKKLSRSRKR